MRSSKMDGQGKNQGEALQDNNANAPKLVKRSLHKKSVILSGRTIGAKRERLETANERAAARKKDKRKSFYRFFFAAICFLVLAGSILALYQIFMNQDTNSGDLDTPEAPSQVPTIEIIDEDAGSTGGKITGRMQTYISRVEECFKEKGYRPQKAVIPSSGIREIRINLEGYNGYIKMIIDRDPAVSVEDADRMLRYLKDRGIEDFTYIDVRIDGKAYWK